MAVSRTELFQGLYLNSTSAGGLNSNYRYRAILHGVGKQRGFHVDEQSITKCTVHYNMANHHKLYVHHFYLLPQIRAFRISASLLRIISIIYISPILFVINDFFSFHARKLAPKHTRAALYRTLPHCTLSIFIHTFRLPQRFTAFNESGETA